MSDKILQMFFELDRWTKAIEKGVGKDIRKDQLILLTDENTRLAIADAMRKEKYEISPPHTARIPKENGEFRTVYVNEPIKTLAFTIYSTKPVPNTGNNCKVRPARQSGNSLKIKHVEKHGAYSTRLGNTFPDQMLRQNK